MAESLSSRYPIATTRGGTFCFPVTTFFHHDSFVEKKKGNIFICLVALWSVIIVLGLVEQEVRRELLVLVAGEVSLNGLVAVKAKTTKLETSQSVILIVIN